MATWHQQQARKRPGFRLYHDTKWTVLHDAAGQMSSGMLFDTEAAAQAYLDNLTPERRQHSLILKPANVGAV